MLRARRIFPFRATTFWLGQSITSVVPDQHIDAFLKEKPQVKGMWVVNHVLVEHSIRVAENKRGSFFVG